MTTCIIGAGCSGFTTAKRLKELLPDVDCLVSREDRDPLVVR